MIVTKRHTSLWLSIAGPFLLFVVAGSLALAAWMQSAARRESHAVFAALAATNAEFIRSAHLPATEQMMSYLGHLLNMRACLAMKSGELLPAGDDTLGVEKRALVALQPGMGVVRLNRDYEGIAARIDADRRLLLVRPVEPLLAFAWRRESLVVLGAFWIFSVALAWVITRGVVHPLKMLAERLPTIERDVQGTLPGAERSDEIGQVARAYLETRAQLAEERQRREAAERQALLGRMATGLAHEIHNPLSAIRMHAQILESAASDELEAMLQEVLPVLISETIRIESLVNQWMFLARPEPPRMSGVLLVTIVESVLRAHGAMASHAGVRFERNICGDLAVMADARRLSQAVANIVINGIQAMKRGGVLKITAAMAGDGVRLDFHDAGEGFSREALARHRELFFSQKEGGMGIGLSVTAEIIEAHGGRLEIANEPAGGAQVTIRLPVIPAGTPIRELVGT